MAESTAPPSPLTRAGVDAKLMLQASVLLFSMVGGIIGIYITIENRVAIQSERITILQQQLTEILKSQQHSNEEQKAVARDIGQALTKVSEQMADLRVLVAERRSGIR
jgi:dihydroxyacid dehydratase/phosphogluconate dehydratase